MKKFLLTLFAIVLSSTIFADIPAPTNKLVNDFASVMTTEQAIELECALRLYNDSTSTQLCVVTVESLDDLTPAEYAQQLGEKWGVGQVGKDNGVIILVKKKTKESCGDVFIATGYGVEGLLPDAICKRIVERTMIPKLKEGDYHGAIVDAISEIQKYLSGEFKADEINSEDFSWWNIALIVFIFILFIMFIADGGSHSGGSSSYSSGGSSSFSSGGSSSFSFGGGSFGGGGAGGSF